MMRKAWEREEAQVTSSVPTDASPFIDVGRSAREQVGGADPRARLVENSETDAFSLAHALVGGNSLVSRRPHSSLRPPSFALRLALSLPPLPSLLPLPHRKKAPSCCSAGNPLVITTRNTRTSVTQPTHQPRRGPTTAPSPATSAPPPLDNLPSTLRIFGRPTPWASQSIAPPHFTNP